MQIRVWNLDSGECEATFNGHRGAVTALRYNPSGALLASGSRDTDIVVWDVAGEAGLFRLRGHRGQVTDLAFVSRANKLVSSSKDEQVGRSELEGGEGEGGREGGRALRGGEGTLPWGRG